MGYSEALFYIFHKRFPFFLGQGGEVSLCCSFQMGVVWQAGTQMGQGDLDLPCNQRSCLQPLFNKQFSVCPYINLGVKAYSLLSYKLLEIGLFLMEIFSHSVSYLILTNTL